MRNAERRNGAECPAVTGEPDDQKWSRPVREGDAGKGPAQQAPRQRPTSPSRSLAGGATCTGRSTSTRRFFTRALRYGPSPVEVTTDKAGPYLRVLDELAPNAMHFTEQFANNRIEADHARLKGRVRPMRGLTRLRSAEVIAGGHAFVQNLSRGHYELANDVSPILRSTTAFTKLALAM